MWKISDCLVIWSPFECKTQQLCNRMRKLRERQRDEKRDRQRGRERDRKVVKCRRHKISLCLLSSRGKPYFNYSFNLWVFLFICCLFYHRCSCYYIVAVMADGVLSELNLIWMERTEGESDRKRQGEGACFSPSSETRRQRESLA